SAYFNLELIEGAILHRKWLADYRRAKHGDESPEHMRALASLAFAYIEGGHEVQGQGALPPPIGPVQKLGGPEAPRVSDVIHTPGNAYMRDRNYEQALQYGLPAAKGLARAYGDNSTIACTAYWNLSGAYRGLGRQEDVREMYARAMPGLALSEKNNVITRI